MKITINRSSKLNEILLFICVIGFLLVTFCFFLENSKTKDYIMVIGSVSNISCEIDSGIENGSRNTVVKYIECEYVVNGKIHHEKYRTFFSIFKKTGQEIKIYYSPEDPTETKDLFISELVIGAGIFLSLFIAFLSYSLKGNRKIKNG